MIETPRTFSSVLVQKPLERRKIAAELGSKAKWLPASASRCHG